MSRFCNKNRKESKIKNMFPKLKKEKQTRKSKAYVVRHANTKRLQQSSIIYMQNLLNNHQNSIQKSHEVKMMNGNRYYCL